MGGRGTSSGQSERAQRERGITENDYSTPISSEVATETSNPHYDASVRANDRKYTENCNRCWIAYEEQRKGLECEAQPTFAGDTWPYCSQHMEKAYVGAQWVDCTGTTISDHHSVDY